MLPQLCGARVCRAIHHVFSLRCQYEIAVESLDPLGAIVSPVGEILTGQRQKHELNHVMNGHARLVPP